MDGSDRVQLGDPRGRGSSLLIGWLARAQISKIWTQISDEKNKCLQIYVAKLNQIKGVCSNDLIFCTRVHLGMANNVA